MLGRGNLRKRYYVVTDSGRRQEDSQKILAFMAIYGGVARAHPSLGEPGSRNLNGT